MKVRVIASLVTALCLAFTGTAFASSIGVFFAADGSDCDAVQVPGPFTFWIGAVLNADAAAGGITGAEFRIDGVPQQPEWFMTATRNPLANLSVGDPVLAGAGANIAFPVCQPEAGGSFLLLYTVSGFAQTAPVARTFKVERHTTPSNSNFPCPLLVLCNAPVFTLLCVPGGEAFLNGGPCTVAVEEKSWSSVKSLFN